MRRRRAATDARAIDSTRRRARLPRARPHAARPARERPPAPSDARTRRTPRCNRVRDERRGRRRDSRGVGDRRARTSGDAPADRVRARRARDYLAAEYDVVVVGAGLSGCAIAERCSRALGMKVLALERRAHAGGNCYDYVDARTGIRGVEVRRALVSHETRARVGVRDAVQRVGAVRSPRARAGDARRARARGGGEGARARAHTADASDGERAVR